MAKNDDKPRTSATIIGKVESVGKEQTRGSFTYREVIVIDEPDGKYPSPIVIEFSGKNIDKATSLAPGDTCSIACNVKGRRWTNPNGGEVKHFLSLSGWAIADHNKSGRAAIGGAGDARPAPADESDDIPFASCSLAHDPSPIAPALRRPT